MPKDYEPGVIERRWQERWEKEKVNHTDLENAGDPYYNLVMFPYPSGDKLHVGHWYNFAPADSWGRFQRMQGKTVFEPMGFDAFGLPAENYAIKTGVDPNTSICDNVKTMIAQLKRIGTMYDWDKMVNTSLPEYYRWTQWLFLRMYEKGLAFKKLGNVNWCPKDQTVLANEQAQDGKCDRCGTEIVQKPLEQWFWRITDYSQRLLDGLDSLDWPEKTKTMQRNWIGRKEGINIEYQVEGTPEKIVCFTTRPDTNFGATFLVLAPEHSFVQKIVCGDVQSAQREAVAKYVQTSMSKTELERQAEGKKKTGVSTGFSAINNVNGRQMPIWVSDFVLGGFGTGAVVGVPGHDLRDFEFAMTFGIPIIRVVVGPDGDTSDISKPEQVQEEAGTMVNSEFLNGMDIHAATQKIMEHFEQKSWGKRIVTFRLRDWLVSRQRYWGAPIPIVYDPHGNAHAIPEEHLPWLLPTDVEFKPTGESPLRQSKEFIARTEKIFGEGWRPEFDTMDTFVCSSFYYLRYLASDKREATSEKQKQDKLNASSLPLTAEGLINKDIEAKWMPVSMYIGGPEHACMHLIYARFVMMALNDWGFVSHSEPFQRLVHQGLITNKGAKMSKSKGNVVSPDEFVDRYGADVFRMFLMFMGPFTQGGDWNDTGIRGIDRFVNRLYRLFEHRHAKDVHVKKEESTDDAADAPDVMAALHAAIKKVTDDIGKLQFNTAISAMMELLNFIEDRKDLSHKTLQTIALLMGPLAPHLAEELWSLSGGQGFVINQPWPSFNPSLLVTTAMTIAIQVNGKLRGSIEVATDLPEPDIIAQAKALPNVAKYLEGSTIKKEIYVKGKLVSIVL